MNPAMPGTSSRSGLEVETKDLDALARQVRAKLVLMSHETKAAHLGGALSCVDILVAAYWTALSIDPANPWWEDRDRFIMSKGHAVAALYATLTFRGLITPEILATYAKPGSALAEHPSGRSAPGIEVSTGSLGHGLSLGLGMALAGRLQGKDYRVVVLLGDGECNEGSVWEAAMFGAAQQLHNVLAIVDYNGWQATGRSDEILALSPLKQKWEAFGWEAQEVDGHDLSALVSAMAKRTETMKPQVVIARTIKGRGVSFMEDDNNWHYRIPTAAEVASASAELMTR